MGEYKDGYHKGSPVECPHGVPFLLDVTDPVCDKCDKMNAAFKRDRQAARAMKKRGDTARVVCRLRSELAVMFPSETPCSCEQPFETLCYQEVLPK